MADNFSEQEKQYQREQRADNIIANLRGNPDAIRDTLVNMEYSERKNIIPPQWEVLPSGVLMIHHYLDADKLRKAIEDARKCNFKIDTIAFASDVRQVSADCFALADKDCGVTFDENGERSDNSNVCFSRFEDYSDFPTTNGDNSSFEIKGSRAQGLFSHLKALQQICFFGHGVCEQRAAGHPVSLIGDDSRVKQLVLGTTGGAPYIAEKSFASTSRALGSVINLNSSQVVNFGKNAFAYSRDEDNIRSGIELLESKPHLGKGFENAEQFIDSLTEQERAYVKEHPHFGLQFVEKSRQEALERLKADLVEIRETHIPVVRNRCDDEGLYRKALERKLGDLVGHRKAIEEEMIFLSDLKEKTIVPQMEEYEKDRKAEEGLLHVNQEALRQMSGSAALLELNSKRIEKVKKQIEKNEKRLEAVSRAFESAKMYVEGIDIRLEELSSRDAKYLHESSSIESQMANDVELVSLSMKKASDEGRLYLGIDNIDMSNIEDRAFLNTSLQTEPLKDNARAVMEAKLDNDYNRSVDNFVRVAGLMDSLIIDRENFIKSDVYKDLEKLSDRRQFFDQDVDFASIRENFKVLVGRVNEYDLVTKSSALNDLEGLENPSVKRNILKYADNLLCDIENCRVSLDSLGGRDNSECRSTISRILGKKYDAYIKDRDEQLEKEDADNSGIDPVRDEYEKSLVDNGIINHDLLLLSRRMKLSKKERAEVENAFRKVFDNRREKEVVSRAWGTRTGKQSFFNSDINAVIDSDADRIIRKRNEIAKKLNDLQEKNDKLAEKIEGWDGTSWGQAYNAEIRNLKFELDGLQKTPRTKEADKEAFAMNDRLSYISTDFEMRDGVYAFDGNRNGGLISYDAGRAVGEKGGVDIEKLENKDCRDTFNNSFIYDLKIASLNCLKWALSLNMLSVLGGRRLTLSQSLVGMASGAAVALIALSGAVCKAMYGPLHEEENEKLTDAIIKNALADNVTNNNSCQHTTITSGPTVLFDGKYVYMDSADSSFGQLESRIRDYQKWKDEYEKLFRTSKTDEKASKQLDAEDSVIQHELFKQDDEKTEAEQEMQENIQDSTQDNMQDEIQEPENIYSALSQNAQESADEEIETSLDDSMNL